MYAKETWLVTDIAVDKGISVLFIVNDNGVDRYFLNNAGAAIMAGYPVVREIDKEYAEHIKSLSIDI
jgi:tRNA nucleotidyltransferase (CCA-adding enzyme)